MAREITEDDWPARVTDDEVIARVGGQAFLRGQRYCDEGRVLALSVSAGGDILMAQVRGSGRSYQTMLHARDRGEAATWSGTCSCPVSSSCKHVAAVVLAARRQALAAQAAPPSWESELAALLRVSEPGHRTMALEVAEAPRPGWPSDPGLSLLPLIAGKRGWNRQGAAWNQVLSGSLRGEVDGEVLLALQEIGRMAPNGFYYADDRVFLNELPPRLWDVLRRGARAGLVLTTSREGGAEVRIEPGLRAGVSLQRLDDEGQGGLSIAATLDLTEVEGVPWGPQGQDPQVGEVGSPVHGFYTWRPDASLLLMPVEPAPGEVLARLLAARARPVVVPEQDVPRFEAEHLEALTRAVPVLEADAGLRVPEPTQLRALLRVSVDGATHTAQSSWWMRYVSTDGEVRREEEVGGLDAESVAESVAGPGARGTERGAEDQSSPPVSSRLSTEDSEGQDAPAQHSHPPRDLTGERRLAREIICLLIPLAGEHGVAWRPHSFSGLETAKLVARTLPVLERLEAFDVEVVGDVPDYREEEDAPLITTSVGEDADARPDWFSLQVRVRVGEDEIPIERLMQAVATGRTEVLLDSGAWVDVDRPELHALARLMEEGRELEDPRAKGSGCMQVTPFHAGFYQELVRLGVVGESQRRWRRSVDRLLALTAEGVAEVGTESAATGGSEGAAEAADPTAVSVPSGLRATLRPYQLEGYRWLHLLRSTGLGGVLADDMGLGKTVQVLAEIQRAVEERGAAAAKGDAAEAAEGGAAGAAADLPEDGRAGSGSGAAADLQPGSQTSPKHDSVPDKESAPGGGPVLVVAPTSVVGSWAEQAARFCPGLRVRTVTQTAAKRRTPLAQIAAQADVVVTSYTIVRLDEEEMTGVGWSWVVLDEAQFVKNHTSATYRAVRRLRTPSTVAITGTPMENSLMDLWALLSVSAPGLLPGPERFTAVYRRPIDRGSASALAALRTRIHPFMLRRTKEQVAGDLPEKTEQVLTVDLPPAHRRAYEARLIRERQKVMGLLKEDTAQARFTALKSLTTLRLMSLDPALVDDEDAEGTAGGIEAVAGGPGAAGAPAVARRRRPSAKVQVLMDQLGPVVAEGHKALVFSQFTRYLGGVREVLEDSGMRTAYLDGSTSNRQAVIDSFRAGEADVFLISLKAGGFGLTLTEADYVFLLDPWWNPQAEEQAVDRVHRIGQDKPVMVYRLVSEATIEEKVMALKDKKAELFDRVVEGADQDVRTGAATVGKRARLTAQEIRDLVVE